MELLFVLLAHGEKRPRSYFAMLTLQHPTTILLPYCKEIVHMLSLSWLLFIFASADVSSCMMGALWGFQTSLPRSPTPVHTVKLAKKKFLLNAVLQHNIYTYISKVAAASGLPGKSPTLVLILNRHCRANAHNCSITSISIMQQHLY